MHKKDCLFFLGIIMFCNYGRVIKNLIVKVAIEIMDAAVARDFLLRRLPSVSIFSTKVPLGNGVSMEGHPSGFVSAKYMLSAVLFLLCLCCPAISNAASSNTGDAEKMKLTKDDNGRNISIALGSIVEIELSTASGTGYEWSVTKLDEQYLALIKEEKIVARPQDDKVGQPVVKRWYLRALRAGATEVVISLYRSWEGKDRPSDLFSINIDISLMADKER